VIPVPLLVFGAAAAALVGRAVVGQVRLRRSGYRPWRTAPVAGDDHQFMPDSSSTFHGAGVHPPVQLSGPRAVKLQLDRAWVHLYGTGGLINVWIPRDRITGVMPVRMTTNTAIRFLSASGDFDGVLFYSRSPMSLLASLKEHGWPVTDPRESA
jgi:hypothetical protein